MRLRHLFRRKPQRPQRASRSRHRYTYGCKCDPCRIETNKRQKAYREKRIKEGNPRGRNRERDLRIVKLAKQGRSEKQLAAWFKLDPVRIRQILKETR